jgi:diguanylate cyclase (GGDEF)-like protein
MISLKKYIESDGEEVLKAALSSYRQALEAMGNSGFRACPAMGGGLRQSLLSLQQALEGNATPRLLQETEQKVTAELEQWGSSAADYSKQRVTQIKELMVTLAGAAEVAGERDQRYVKQFHDFTGRLTAIADLCDLAQIRDSLMKSAIDLKSCATAMAEESQKAVAKLREDVGAYQVRLDDAERLAGLDALTGLDNRSKVETTIEFRLSRGRPFSIMILDLNGFKKINDTYGHLAGDELLKKFASELKGAFRAMDVIGRWGGDEFVVVLDCDAREAGDHRIRVAKWIFGDYTVESQGAPRKIIVTGAVGIAVSKQGDSLRTLLQRADEDMYHEKRTAAKPAA